MNPASKIRDITEAIKNRTKDTFRVNQDGKKKDIAFGDMVIFLRTFLDKLPLHVQFIMAVLAALGKKPLDNQTVQKTRNYHEKQLETEVVEMRQAAKDKSDYHADQITLWQKQRAGTEKVMAKEPTYFEEIDEAKKKPWSLWSTILFAGLILFTLVLIIADVVNIQALLFDNTSIYTSSWKTWLIAVAVIVGFACLLYLVGKKLGDVSENAQNYYQIALMVIGVISLMIFFALLTRFGLGFGEDLNLSVDFESVSENVSNMLNLGNTPSLADWFMALGQILGGACGVAGFIGEAIQIKDSHGARITLRENENRKKLFNDVADMNSKIARHKKFQGEYKALLELIETCLPNYLDCAEMYLRSQHRLFSIGAEIV